MKARAPPPPGPPQPAPRKIFSTTRNVVPDGGGQGGDKKENMVYSMVDFRISLPGGFQTDGTADGRYMSDIDDSRGPRYNIAI